MPIRPLPDLRPLADEALISQLKSLVRRERAITLAVLMRLIEVERRGLHLRRYSSLFHYCVDRLGYSGSAAGRRIAAARCLREFPRAYEMLLEGHLNLTTLCRVARVLTKENEADLLQRVAGKPDKEVERIVAALSRPIQPREIIRPLRVRTGSAGSSAPRTDPSVGASSAGESGADAPKAVSGVHVPSVSVSNANVPNPDASAHVPSVGVSNENVPNPDASAHGPNVGVPNADVSSASVPSALSSGGIDVTTGDTSGTTSNLSQTTSAALATGSSRASEVPVAGAAANPARGKIDSSCSEDPLSYRIAITVDEAFMKKLERARALVSRSRPGVSVADVFCRTLDEYLMRHDPEQRMARRQQRTEKKEAATRITPQVAPSVRPVDPDADPAAPRASKGFDPELLRETPHRSSDPTMRPEKFRQGTGGLSAPGYITAAMRDAVWARDGGRCTYVGPEGRCPETRGLHVDHRHPKSLGGVAALWSLRLICGPHNQSEADRVLGKDFMDLRRRRTPGLGVTIPESGRSTSGGDALRRETKHVECPDGTDADRAST